MSNMKKAPVSCRKWMITINNPSEHGFERDSILVSLQKIKNIEYFCICDEVGGIEHTYHTHLYIYRNSPILFSTLKRIFPCAHLDACNGTSRENRDYVRKDGKWKDSEKSTTNLKDTFFESGEMPVEQQGKRSDLETLYGMIKDGMSTFEILEENPRYMKNMEQINKCREILRYEEFKNKLREIEVEYWYGKTGTGKSSGLWERYGENIYRVTDSKNPWDGYAGQDVVVFEEFRGEYDIQTMLIWLDRYPLQLPCRYNNKTACYTKVFFTSNTPPDMLYTHVQRDSIETWKAFMRRVHCVKKFDEHGIVDYKGIDEYLSRWESVKDIDIPLMKNMNKRKWN